MTPLLYISIYIQLGVEIIPVFESRSIDQRAASYIGLGLYTGKWATNFEKQSKDLSKHNTGGVVLNGGRDDFKKKLRVQAKRVTHIRYRRRFYKFLNGH